MFWNSFILFFLNFILLNQKIQKRNFVLFHFFSKDKITKNIKIHVFPFKFQSLYREKRKSKKKKRSFQNYLSLLPFYFLSLKKVLNSSYFVFSSKKSSNPFYSAFSLVMTFIFFILFYLSKTIFEPFISFSKTILISFWFHFISRKWF